MPATVAIAINVQRGGGALNRHQTAGTATVTGGALSREINTFFSAGPGGG